MTVAAEICPQCGAPLHVVNGRCAYCETPLRLTGPIVASTDAPTPSAPTGDPGAPFSMPVDDVFVIKGKGTVAIGCIATGTLTVGSALVLDHGGKARKVICTEIEMFRKKLDAAVAGNNVGLVLQDEKNKDLKRDDVTKGDTLRAP